jgi:hypothetical protein
VSGGRGDADGYQEGGGELGVAGEGRAAPESSTEFGRRSGESAILPLIRRAPGRFLAPGEGGERGGPGGGLSSSGEELERRRHVVVVGKNSGGARLREGGERKRKEACLRRLGGWGG